MSPLKKIISGFLSTSALFVVCEAVSPVPRMAMASQQQQQQILWVENLSTAVRYSTANNIPILLHFYGDNCPPCRMLEKRAFQDPQLINKINSTVVAVKINGEREKEIRDRYGVTRWPTDVFLLPNGDEIYRTVSPQDPAVYGQVVDRIAMRHRDWRAGAVADAEYHERQLNHRTATQIANNAGQEYRPASATAASTPILNSAPSRHPVHSLPPTTMAVASAPVSVYPSGAPTANGATYSAVPGIHGSNALPIASDNGARADSLTRSQSMVAGMAPALPQINTPTNVQRTISNPHLAQGPIVVPAATPASPTIQTLVGGPSAPSSLPPIASPQSGPYPTETNRVDGPNPPEAKVAREPAAVGVPATTIASRLEANRVDANSNTNAIGVASMPQHQPVPKATASVDEPKVGMDGFCPVTLYLTVKGVVKNESCWVEGSASYAVKHRGRIYLCASEEMRGEFLKAPDVYAPCLSCFDLIHYINAQEFIDGKCEFGCFQSNTGRIFLFSSQENCDEFRRNEAYYSQIVSSQGQSERVANQPETTSVR